MKIIILDNTVAYTISRGGKTVNMTGTTLNEPELSNAGRFRLIEILGNANYDNDRPALLGKGMLLVHDDCVVSPAPLHSWTAPDNIGMFTAHWTIEPDWAAFDDNGELAPTWAANTLAMAVVLTDYYYGSKFTKVDWRDRTARRAAHEAMGAVRLSDGLVDVYLYSHDGKNASPEGAYVYYLRHADMSTAPGTANVPYDCVEADFTTGVGFMATMWNTVWMQAGDTTDLFYNPDATPSSGGSETPPTATNDGKEVAIAAIAGGVIGYHMGKARA